ncbi:hypothetical protein AB0K05_12985 [Nonomuraea sp. NPDC049486]
MDYDARVAELRATGHTTCQARQQAFDEAMHAAHEREERWHDQRGCC